MRHLLPLGKPNWVPLFSLVLGELFWSGCFGYAAAQDLSPLAKRFLKEAPPAWAQHQEFYLTLEGIGRGARRLRNTEGKWTVTPSNSSFKQHGGNMLDQWEDFESGVWKGQVRGENSDYIFVLLRSSEKKPWVIQSVTKKTESSQLRWEGRVDAYPGLLVAPRVPSLPKIVKSKGFKCSRAELESIGGEELVRVTFTFAPEGTNRLKQGWVILDPSRYWVVRKSEVEVDLGEKLDGMIRWTNQVDYREGSNRHPILTKGVFNGKTWRNGRVDVEEEYPIVVDAQERPSIPESEFTLSAFGLPEPYWGRPKKTPWFLWFGVGGIGCLTLAAGVHWIKRRRAAA